MKVKAKGDRLERNVAGLQASDSSGPDKKLTARQARFVWEFLLDLNATQAAIRSGYSLRTANRTASENLSKPVIQEAIQKAQLERSKRLEMSADKVSSEIAKIAFSDARKLFDENGNLIPVHLLDDDTAVTIARIEVTEIEAGEDAPLTRIKKIKPLDKLKALELLGKHLALFTDRVVAKVEFDIDVILRDLSGSTRGLPSLMQCNLKSIGGGDDQQE